MVVTVALTRIDSRDTTVVERSEQDNTLAWSGWKQPAATWLNTDMASGVIIGVLLPRGRYRVEPIGGRVRHWPNTGEVDNYTTPFFTEGGTLRAYSDQNPATHLFITRLA